MREFLLNKKMVPDPDQLSCLNQGGQDTLLPCKWIRFNDRIKLAFFPDGCVPVSRLVPELSLDDACLVSKHLLKEVMRLEEIPELILENLVLDIDSIYLEAETGALRLIYMPIISEEDEEDEADEKQGRIYVKRIYAVLEELLERVAGGETIVRQIEFQKDREPGNWNLLKEALDKRIPVEIAYITLKGAEDGRFKPVMIGHEEMRVGTDQAQVQIVLDDEGSIDPVHAMIGWNGISFFVMDLDSGAGTFVNDTRIASNTQIPIGPDSSIRFGNLTFSVE